MKFEGNKINKNDLPAHAFTRNKKLRGKKEEEDESNFSLLLGSETKIVGNKNKGKQISSTSHYSAMPFSPSLTQSSPMGYNKRKENEIKLINAWCCVCVLYGIHEYMNK
jgi:hypothetical protein